MKTITTLALALISTASAATFIQSTAFDGRSIANATHPEGTTPYVNVDVDGDGTDDVSYELSISSSPTAFTPNSGGGTDTAFLFDSGGDATFSVAVTGFTALNTSNITINSVTWNDFSSFELRDAGGATTDLMVNGVATTVDAWASFTTTGDIVITEEASAANGWRIRNIVGDATIDYDVVTVPEPTSATLLGLGALALVVRRKR